MSQKYNLNFNLVHSNNESNFTLIINNIKYTGNIIYNYYDKDTTINLLNLIYLRINNGQYFCNNKNIVGSTTLQDSKKSISSISSGFKIFK